MVRVFGGGEGEELRRKERKRKAAHTYGGQPGRIDLGRILILGSGPLVTGRAAEFDYSGTQGGARRCAKGYREILVNSNPGTIATEPRPG